jgi:hypothetical protein
MKKSSKPMSLWLAAAAETAILSPTHKGILFPSGNGVVGAVFFVAISCFGSLVDNWAFLGQIGVLRVDPILEIVKTRK